MSMTRAEFDKIPFDEQIHYLKQFSGFGELWTRIERDHVICKSDDLRDADYNISSYITSTTDDWTVVRAVLNNLSYAIDDANAGFGWVHCECREHPYGYTELTPHLFKSIVSEYVGTEAYDAAFEEHGQEVFSGLEGLL